MSPDTVIAEFCRHLLQPPSAATFCRHALAYMTGAPLNLAMGSTGRGDSLEAPGVQVPDLPP